MLWVVSVLVIELLTRYQIYIHCTDFILFFSDVFYVLQEFKYMHDLCKIQLIICYSAASQLYVSNNDTNAQQQDKCIMQDGTDHSNVILKHLDNFYASAKNTWRSGGIMFRVCPSINTY